MRLSNLNSGSWSKLLIFGCYAFAGIRLAGATLVLTGARIIDGTGRAPLENGVVVLEGKQILDVGPADKIQAPAGAEVVDVHGKSIIPALISAHSHLGLCKERSVQSRRTTPARMFNINSNNTSGMAY